MGISRSHFYLGEVGEEEEALLGQQLDARQEVGEGDDGVAARADLLQQRLVVQLVQRARDGFVQRIKVRRPRAQLRPRKGKVCVGGKVSAEE